jgi:hypothetical protein
MRNKEIALGPLEVQLFAYTQMRGKVLVRTGEITNARALGPGLGFGARLVILGFCAIHK